MLHDRPRLLRFSRHPEYDEDTIDDDFNLVFLRKSVTFDDVTYVPPNFDPSLTYPEAPLSVVGWGDLDPCDEVSDSTRRASIRLSSYHVC
ncbi:hypothetical protein ACHAWF_008220, partial [Thalassiosira exigua]